MSDNATTTPLDPQRFDLELLRARDQLNRVADEAIERAIQQQLPLQQTLDRLMPLAADALGADAVVVETYDEDLVLRSYTWRRDGQQGLELDRVAILARAALEACAWRVRPDLTVVGQPIDVAGQAFGAAAVVVSGPLEREQAARRLALLDVWCEELDNYLASIALARRKHQTVSELAAALKRPLLADGVDRAIAVLHGNIDFDDMILIFRHDTGLSDDALAYRIVKSGAMVHASDAVRDAELDAFVRRHAGDALLHGTCREIAERFDLQAFREQVLINGVQQQQVVGRVIVGRSSGREFSTFDRDLLERFADFLRQRIVDFNREWRQLSLCFPRPTVRRLLAEEDYRATYLEPREREVAVLFCDIAGFTRVSEQVLKQPALIGKLVDTWSARVVDLIWQAGGVFDKMVGDCIIGLWGPPFYDWTAEETCARAAKTAVAIRDYTALLGRSGEMPELVGVDPPLGVATGLNYCPLYIGLFGPDENFTGFSAGMNNTARLQGVAVRDEILCMASMAELLDGRARFGPGLDAKVKNVAEPLPYRKLLGFGEDG